MPRAARYSASGQPSLLRQLRSLRATQASGLPGGCGASSTKTPKYPVFAPAPDAVPGSTTVNSLMLQLTVTGRVTSLLAFGLSIVNRSSTRNASPCATQPDVSSDSAAAIAVAPCPAQRRTALLRSCEACIVPLAPLPPPCRSHRTWPAAFGGDDEAGRGPPGHGARGRTAATRLGENDEDNTSAMRDRFGVTRETTVRSVADRSTATVAASQALAVAERAGVRVVELHDLDGLRSAAELYQLVWQTETRAAPVSPDLMRALSHAGGYVAGAYDGDRLVAASLAFHTDGAEAGLHSHISAVVPDVQGRDVGVALKLHQRAWALERGLQTISWTYDPLLRRNAWFNISKLGARAVGYLVNFYGVMDDAQNVGDESDRAVALWSLEAPYVVRAADGDRIDHGLEALLRGGAFL